MKLQRPTIPCKHCKQPFTPKKKRQTICSPGCRMAWAKKAWNGR